MQIECFPDAPPDWTRYVFNKVAQVNPRYRLDKRKEYPFVEMASVAEHFGGIRHFDLRSAEGSGLSRFRLNDILFGKITPCAENGKVALVKELADEFGLGSTEFIVLSPRSGFDPRYVYSLACSTPVLGRAISRMEGSTGRLRVTDDTFTKWLLVAVPELEEQQAIARILDSVDVAIERTRTAIEKAEKLRRGLAHTLLKCGIDDRGRVRNPQTSPDQFHVTPVGRVPVVWTISKVLTEFDLATGFTLGEHRRPKVNKRKYLRVANVQRERIDLNDVLELEATDVEMEGRRLEENDLLIVEGHANPYEIGRCALVKAEAVGLTFQNHLFRLRSRGISPAFGCHWLNSEFARRYWRRKCGTSSGLNTINQRMLKSLPVVAPDEKEQERIVALLEAADRKIHEEYERLKKAEKLKRGLMQDLLTGRVRVKLPAHSGNGAVRSRP